MRRFTDASCLLWALLQFVPLALTAEQPVRYSRSVHDVFTSLEKVQASISEVQEPDAFDCVLSVGTQDDFDNLGRELDKAITGGKRTILVDMAIGSFFYKSQSVQLNGKKHPDLRIHFRGHGTVLYPDGFEAVPGEPYPAEFTTQSCFLPSSGQDLSPWSKSLQSDRRVEVVDKTSRKCRIHYKDIRDLDSLSCASALIQISESYTSERFNVDYIKGGYIYFTPSSLSRNGTDCLNLDHNFGGVFPRFRLCNVPGFQGEFHVDTDGVFRHDGGKVHVGTANRFIFVHNSTIGCLELSGIDFKGAQGGNALLTFRYLKATEGVFIHDCAFHDIKGVVIEGIKSENLFIHDCDFEGCHRDCVNTDNGCSHVQVHHNSFVDCGKDWSNAKCVVCHGADYYVAYNDFRNFGYSAIGVGCWRGQKMDNTSFGIVEWNTMSYDKSYSSRPFDNLMMDSGAIYTWTQQRECIIRYNKVHGYTGRKYNHAIYCDDGAFNVKIYGNVITDIPMGYCVGLRYVKLSQSDAQRFDRTNEGNFLAYNLLQGNYQFAGTPVKKDNGCIKGENLMVGSAASLKSGLVSGAQIKAEDVRLGSSVVDTSGRVLLGRSDYDLVLKNLPLFSRLGVSPLDQ